MLLIYFLIYYLLVYLFFRIKQGQYQSLQTIVPTIRGKSAFNKKINIKYFESTIRTLKTLLYQCFISCLIYFYLWPLYYKTR